MAIYVIRADKSGPIKIGFTKGSARKRLHMLQTANHVALELLTVLDGGQGKEEELHARFAKDRIRGEWFNPSPELLAFIAANPAVIEKRRAPRRQRTRFWKALSRKEKARITAVWFDKSIPSDLEAEKLLGGISRQAVRVNLGPSGRADPVAAGRAGARKRWGFKERTPIRTAAKVWKNYWDYPSPSDALSHSDMAGWTESTARKYLGKRGAPPGPISSRDKD